MTNLDKNRHIINRNLEIVMQLLLLIMILGLLFLTKITTCLPTNEEGKQGDGFQLSEAQYSMVEVMEGAQLGTKQDFAAALGAHEPQAWRRSVHRKLAQYLHEGSPVASDMEGTAPVNVAISNAAAAAGSHIISGDNNILMIMIKPALRLSMKSSRRPARRLVESNKASATGRPSSAADHHDHDARAFHVDYSGPRTHPPRNN